MNRMRLPEASGSCSAFSILLLLVSTGYLLAGTTGTLTGAVTDSEGGPVTGASVIVEGTGYGSMTDAEGIYVIIGLSPGEYRVTARMVGMAPSTHDGVTVIADRTTINDFPLETSSVGSTIITVVDQRREILQLVPSTMHVVTRQDLPMMPVFGILDIVTSQPGVAFRNGDIHIRGGRGGEVEFLVDGMPLRSPVNGTLSGSLPAAAMEEISMLTGGFPAEYGNAMSGIVNIITREGGADYEGSVSVESGARTEPLGEGSDQGYFASSENDSYHGGVTSGQFALGGPEPLSTYMLPALGLDLPGEIRFFAAGEYDRSGFDHMDSRDFWSNSTLLERNGVMKLSWRLVNSVRFDLTGIYDYREQGWDEWAWSRYGLDTVSVEPDVTPLPRRFNENYGLSMTTSVLLGGTSLLKASVCRSGILYRQRISDGEGGWIGDGYGIWDWFNFVPGERSESPEGFYVTGIHPEVWRDSRCMTETAAISLTSRVHPAHTVSTGLEARWYDVYDFSVFAEDFSAMYINRWEAAPTALAAFLQDRILFRGGMTVEAGLRLDRFDPRESVYSITEDTLLDAEPKVSLSPRLGFTHPVTDRAVLFFNYGHFFQMPDFDHLYLGSGYSMSGAYALMGNPDLEPERTILYEAGLRWMLGQTSSITLSTFSKDITGLLSTSEQDGVSQYNVFENDNSHGSVRGFELVLLRRPLGWISGSLDYTYSIAQGRYSSSTDGYAYSQEEFTFPPAEDSYLDWDQRHTAGALLTVEVPRGEGPSVGSAHPLEGSRATIDWHWGSGYPYSPPEGGSELPLVNTDRCPWTMESNLQLSRTFWAWGLTGTLKLTVFNLFNRMNVERIFDSAWYMSDNDGDGSPDVDPEGPYGNPGAWSPARHFLLGLEVDW
jgi:outer membrane receptor protein involved in Fe transport